MEMHINMNDKVDRLVKGVAGYAYVFGDLQGRAATT